MYNSHYTWGEHLLLIIFKQCHGQYWALHDGSTIAIVRSMYSSLCDIIIHEGSVETSAFERVMASKYYGIDP